MGRNVCAWCGKAASSSCCKFTKALKAARNNEREKCAQELEAEASQWDAPESEPDGTMRKVAALLRMAAAQVRDGRTSLTR